MQYTGPLRKLFHYAIFQKFFSHFLHKWFMFYRTSNLILMLFCLQIISTYNQAPFI